MFIFVYIREPAIFVYIREPFSFGPTFGEDFRFDVMFLLMYVHGCTQKRTYIRILGYEVVLAHENHETISFAMNCVRAYVLMYVKGLFVVPNAVLTHCQWAKSLHTQEFRG